MCAGGCGATSSIADGKTVTDTRRMAFCTDCFYVGGASLIIVVDIGAGHFLRPTEERHRRDGKMVLRW
jgi:hypothetical protein